MNTLLRLCFSFLFFLTVTCTAAQKHTVADSAKDNTWLWEVSGKGLKQPSYLYGTIHIICTEDFFISDGLLNALNKSRQLVLETTFGDSTIDLVALFEGAALKDKRLKDFYTAEEYAELVKFFKDSLDMDLELMGSLKPLYFTELMAPKMLGCKKTSAYETELEKMARKQNKEVKGFLGIKEHARLLDTIPDELQARELLRTIRQWEKEKQDFARLIEIYKTQAFYKVHPFMETSENLNQYGGALLDDRNFKWIPQIKKMAAEKPTLFAFGAAHLGGENGIINLLRKAGYTVKPLEN